MPWRYALETHATSDNIGTAHKWFHVVPYQHPRFDTFHMGYVNMRRRLRRVMILYRIHHSIHLTMPKVAENKNMGETVGAVRTTHQ